MFVLAEVVCGASPIPYASVGNDEALQKIHWKKCGQGQGRAYERSWVEIFEKLKFSRFLRCLDAARVANSNRTH